MLIPGKVGAWALKEDELRRRPLPRITVNKGKREGRGCYAPAPLLTKTLSENFSIKLEVGRIPPRMRLPI
jgi:hypothetical protein